MPISDSVRSIEAPRHDRTKYADLSPLHEGIAQYYGIYRRIHPATACFESHLQAIYRSDATAGFVQCVLFRRLLPQHENIDDTGRAGDFHPELLSMLGTRIRHGGVILIKYCRLIADSSSIGVRDNRLARESSHLSLGRCQRYESIDRFERAIDSLA